MLSGIWLYRRAQAALRGSRLGRWFDFRWCEVLVSRRGRMPSDWDRESVWFGEVGAEAARQVRAGRAAGSHPAGARCFAARVEERWAASVWILAGPGQLVSTQAGCAWVLPAGAAWVYDACAHPLYCGTYPDLLRFMRAKLSAEGIHGLLAQVEYDNRGSRRLHTRMGARRLGWVASLRAGGFGVHLRRSHSGFRWGGGRCPLSVPLRDFLPASGPHEVAEAGRIGLVAGEHLG